MYDARWGHREVALKVLRGEMVSGDRDRFLAEARLLMEMTHPGVVKVLAAGELPDGRPYLAMEKLPGESLSRRLSRGPLALGDAVALFVQLCDAVAAMHARSLIHRDLKPENVMLVAGPTGDHAVLLDFGIAKLASDGVAPPTQSGMVRGTPAYMAPERFFGQPASVATDVYELAVTLFAMIAGRLPWADSVDPEVRLNPARLGALAAVPAPLDELVARALSTRAPNRPASVTELCSEVMEAAGATVAPPRSTRPLWAPAEPAAGAPTPGAPTPPATAVTAQASPGLVALRPDAAAPWPSAERVTTGAAASGERAVLTVGVRRRWPLAVAVGASVAIGAIAVVAATRGGPAGPALITGPDDPWSGEGPAPVLVPEPDAADGGTGDGGPEPLPPEERTAMREALAGSLRRQAPDLEGILGLAVAELRRTPETAIAFEALRTQMMLRGALDALIGDCDLPFGDRADWLSMGIAGAFGAYDLIASGEWTRAEIEGCVGGDDAKVKRAGDGGAMSVVTLAGGRVRVIGWIDERTFVVSTRAEADQKFIAARLGRPPAQTRVLELASGIDRRASLWLVATQQSLGRAVTSPALRQADLTARLSLGERDEDGDPVLGFQISTYFADEATAKAGQVELQAQLADLTDNVLFDLALPEWEFRRDGTMVRLHGLVPTKLVDKLQRDLPRLLP